MFIIVTGYGDCQFECMTPVQDSQVNSLQNTNSSEKQWVTNDDYSYPLRIKGLIRHCGSWKHLRGEQQWCITVKRIITKQNHQQPPLNPPPLPSGVHPRVVECIIGTSCLVTKRRAANPLYNNQFARNQMEIEEGKKALGSNRPVPSPTPPRKMIRAVCFVRLNTSAQPASNTASLWRHYCIINLVSFGVAKVINLGPSLLGGLSESIAVFIHHDLN